jgi:mannose-6-phosphate isomerase-like protein (cupin superfamily)
MAIATTESSNFRADARRRPDSSVAGCWHEGSARERTLQPATFDPRWAEPGVEARAPANERRRGDERARVRVATLKPNQSTPWHFHSVVTDNVFCLEEGLEVAFCDPDETVRLRPGQRQDIPPGRVHRVVNTTRSPLRYLLIQATGTYDFNEAK